MHASSCSFARLFAFILTLAWSGGLRADTDYSSSGPGTGAPDGLCDVWQALYNGWNLSPGGDEDHDGATNLMEAEAGTDPRNPSDVVRVGNTTILGTNVVFTFDAEKGKKYRILSDASSPTGAFATAKTIVSASGGGDLVESSTAFIPNVSNAGQTLTIDAAYVETRLAGVAGREDLARYVL